MSQREFPINLDMNQGLSMMTKRDKERVKVIY